VPDETSPCFLAFSLRLDAAEPMQVVAAKVGAALGCALTPGNFARTPAMIARLLGIEIGLLLWRGLGGAHVFELHGVPDRRSTNAEDWREIAIDEAVIDLLRRHGAGEWRVPSVEEKIAASRYDEDDI
jgi:hypothetical protein